MNRVAFKLFVVGSLFKAEARDLLMTLLDDICAGDVTLEIVDVLENASLVQEYGVFATPTLCLEYPAIARVVGDICHRERLAEVLAPLLGEQSA